MNGAELTALQKHVSFFDRNKDGVIYPWETFRGFRAIGAGLGLSVFSAVFIHGSLAPKTRRLQRRLHPRRYRFVAEKFEEIFQRHAHSHHNALTSEELKEMLRSNRVPKDYKGWLGAWTEWKALYTLCKDGDGLLPKETIRAVYDGSLFYKMEEERASSKTA